MAKSKLRLCVVIVACAVPLAGASGEQAKTPPADNSGKVADDAGQVQASHPRRVRLGGISIGAGYTRYSGPYYRCGPYGYYSSFWGGFGPFCPTLFDLYTPFYYPFYHPGFYAGFAYGPNMGEVRLEARSKSAEVFLDGAYAGTADRLKSMWLEPGAYNLEVRAQDRPAFTRRIYVLSGKTLKIDATQEVKP